MPFRRDAVRKIEWNATRRDASRHVTLCSVRIDLKRVARDIRDRQTRGKGYKFFFPLEDPDTVTSVELQEVPIAFTSFPFQSANCREEEGDITCPS